MPNNLKYILVESRYKTYRDLTKQLGNELAVYLDYKESETKSIIKHFNKYPHMKKSQHIQCGTTLNHDTRNLLSK